MTARFLSHTPDNGGLQDTTFSPLLAKYRQTDGSISYDSRSEAACAETACIWIPKWEPIVAVTYQVPIGWRNRRADFAFPESELIVEHHPIDFKFSLTDEHFRELKSILKGLPRNKAERIIDLEKGIVRNFYWALRREVIDQRPEHRPWELIVTNGPADWFEKIIKRLSPSPPARQEFMQEWNRIIHLKPLGPAS